MKAAIFQLDTKDCDIESNLARYESLMRSIDSDTDLVILPEMFARGFTFDKRFAETMDGMSVRFMRNFAQKHHTAVEGSLFIEEDGHFFNRHFFVSENSLQYYDKKHLFCISQEPNVISSGSKKVTVEYKGWKIRLITCYDLRFPLWCRNKAEEGVFDYDLLICVASWQDARIGVWDTLLPARAIENQCYAIGVNRSGVDSGGLNYKGNSAAVDFKGQTLAKAKPDSQEVCYAFLDKGALDKFRTKFPVSRDWDR